MSGRAIVFGAGKVGCGVLGEVLAESGFSTTFVARRPEVIAAIEGAGGYVLDVSGRRTFVPAAGALNVSHAGPVIDAIAASDVVFTALGVDSLKAVAPLLARGLWLRGARRGTPLPVIACENLPGAGSYLGQVVLAAADPVAELAIEDVARFSSALTHRIIAEVRHERGLLVAVADASADLVIDAAPLGDVGPAIGAATYTHRFAAAVMRKLFLLNCAQAAAAYHGHEAGWRYLHEAVADPRIALRVSAAVAESAAALAAELPSDAEVIAADAQAALRRISDPGVRDAITRVAKDPRRKLSMRERLIGPARLAQRHGLPYGALLEAAVAALRYDDAADPQAVAMQADIGDWGLDRVLTEDCGLLPYEELARSLKRIWGASALRRAA